MIEQKEVCINESQVAEGLDIPRDKSGKIRWKILQQDPVLFNTVIEIEAQRFAADGYSLTYTGLYKARRFMLAHLISGDYPGGITTLREKLDLPGRRGNRYWSDPRVIEEQARTFLEAHHDISACLLAENNASSLLNAISSHYPGKLSQIRVYLGLEPRSQVRHRQHANKKGYWDDDQLRKEALGFYNRFGILTPSALRREGRTDLLAAIAKGSPGGFRVIKEKLGIEMGRKDDFWTSERIETEARAFLEQFGKFTTSTLLQNDRNDLIHAIYRYYPGRITALRRHLFLSELRKPPGYWTPKNIEKEALEFYLAHGGLSQRLLYTYKMAGLSIAISKFYPGSFKALKEKLGITYGIENISAEEANEQLRRLVEE